MEQNVSELNYEVVMREAERDLFVRALTKYNGNEAEARKALGLSMVSFLRKLISHNLRNVGAIVTSDAKLLNESQ